MLFSKTKIISDTRSVDAFLDRGISLIYPDKENVRKKLLSGERFSVYLGIDPTSSTLHLGHAIVLKKLGEFQKLGHGVILLIGDFTGMIGDPTGKLSTRKKLTRNEVLNNAKLYKKQASKFLSFSGSNPAKILYNSKWLSRMNFSDVLELASKMTVNQMLERDMFKEREKSNKPIFIHEFLYPLLQGYDSVAMDVSGEIGGNDQIFNMLVGRDLMKQIKNKDKFVLATEILEDSNGKKMGKSEGNGISFTDTPEEMFGKVMSFTDGMIISGFRLCTNLPMDEILKIKNEIESGGNPKDAKVRLAKEIVSFYHSENDGKAAEENFKKIFSSGMIPENVITVKTKQGSLLVDILIDQKIVSSKNEFYRLVNEGAVSDETGLKITDPKFVLMKSGSFKIGKRRFLKIIVD